MDFSIFLHRAECSTEYLQVNVLHMMPVISLWQQDLDLGHETPFTSSNLRNPC